MSARSFDRNAQTRWRSNALNNSQRSFRLFEQRSLFDVQLNECLVIPIRQFHILKISVDSSFSANLIHRFAVTISQVSCGVRGKRSRKQPAPQAADSEA